MAILMELQEGTLGEINGLLWHVAGCSWILLIQHNLIPAPCNLHVSLWQIQPLPSAHHHSIGTTHRQAMDMDLGCQWTIGTRIVVVLSIELHWTMWKTIWKTIQIWGVQPFVWPNSDFALLGNSKATRVWSPGPGCHQWSHFSLPPSRAPLLPRPTLQYLKPSHGSTMGSYGEIRITTWKRWFIHYL